MTDPSTSAQTEGFPYAMGAAIGFLIALRNKRPNDAINLISGLSGMEMLAVLSTLAGMNLAALEALHRATGTDPDEALREMAFFAAAFDVFPSDDDDDEEEGED